MNRIDKKFKELKKNKKKAFIVFITAGYPELKTTEKLIFELAAQGVDIIELGVPFSDPLADGKVIQESSCAALKKGVTLNQILSLVNKVRKNIRIPICLMTYFNPIFCMGEKKFVERASSSGVDGVIIPDLPPEEGRDFISYANKKGLHNICFLAPTSSKERIKLISKIAKGFIYYVSLTGVTGERKALPRDLARNIALIKKYTDKPVCVGFGISAARQVKQVYQFADGAIIGSAIVKKIKENLKNKNLVKKVGNFAGKLQCIIG